jgi:hypothetical protein
MRAWVVITLLTLPGTAASHGGGLNAQGCHNDRRHGDYHCHRTQIATQNLAPVAPRGHPNLRNTPATSLAAPTAATRNVYYANCAAVRAAGAAPIRYGDAGYASHLNRDGDGVGCE